MFVSRLPSNTEPLFARLNALGRWRPITKLDLKAKGAKYFTYIYPKEKLITGLFSEHGTFAYLFRYV
jgi:hypothetical protein